MPIRDFDESLHYEAISNCLVELQDVERKLNPRMPSGADIVDDYIPDMLNRCVECEGKILVAEIDDDVVGYATIMTRVTSEEVEDRGIEYGLVSDLVVMPKYRGQGHGRQLLEAAESYARNCGVKWLRVGVLAGNHSAQELYASMGFASIYVELEKELN